MKMGLEEGLGGRRCIQGVEVRRLRQPWELSLIIKMVGRNVGFSYLYLRLLQLRKPKRELAAIGLGNVIFWQDLAKVKNVVWFSMGDFGLYGIIIYLCRVEADFDSETTKIEHISDRIRIPGIPTHSTNILRQIGNLAAKTMKIDPKQLLNTQRNKPGCLMNWICPTDCHQPFLLGIFSTRFNMKVFISSV